MTEKLVVEHETPDSKKSAIFGRLAEKLVTLVDGPVDAESKRLLELRDAGYTRVTTIDPEGGAQTTR